MALSWLNYACYHQNCINRDTSTIEGVTKAYYEFLDLNIDVILSPVFFEKVNEIRSLSLDNMRDYLGLSKDNAHDAIKDVEDCAKILIRFFFFK